LVTEFLAGLNIVIQMVIAGFALYFTITWIDTIINSIKNWANGVANHISCGAQEFATGWVNTFKTLGIMFQCSWKMFINFINGSCTRYYITDMIIGLTYGVFIQLPLILINAIFGLNLQPIIDFLYKLIVVPIDALFFAISGFHLVNWSDSVINDCYRCKGTYTFANKRKVVLYKQMNEWASLFDCSTEQITGGFLKIFTSIVPNAKWGAWADGEHLPGWDDEPNFLGT
jgi:hypothetical protein